MTEEHGGAIIGEVLARHGVRHLFTLCGGHISPILVGAKGHGISVVDMRDEASAVFAADAAARTTGIVGAAAVTAGPGVTNALTALKNAEMAQTPLLLFGGATATILKGRGSLQDIDQLSLLKPTTKWATSLSTVASLGPAVEKSVARRSGRCARPGVSRNPVGPAVPGTRGARLVHEGKRHRAGQGRRRQGHGPVPAQPPLPAVSSAPLGCRLAHARSAAAAAAQSPRQGGRPGVPGPAARAGDRQPNHDQLPGPAGSSARCRAAWAADFPRRRRPRAPRAP